MEQVNVLVKKWGDILKEGSEIKNNNIEKTTAIMLENELSYLHGGNPINEGTTWSGDSVGHNGANPPGASGIAGDADFYKIAIPMVRRTFPELIAHEVVGVQPMTSPVGLAFALRYKADQSYGVNPTGQELGHNTMDPYYSANPAVSGTFTRREGEELGSNGQAPHGPRDVVDAGGNTFPGVGGGLGIGNGTGIREVSMTLEKAQVEAGTRKLKSRWSIEVSQDLKAMHGLNIEEEMMDILAYEITAEIDRELIYKIKTVADGNPASGVVDYVTDFDGRWEAEKYRNIYNLVIRKSNGIAIATRRGAGNFVIAAPTVCAALEATSAFTVAPSNASVSTGQTGVAKVGSLDGRMQVYRDTFATNDDLVIGYKGASSYDTGIIYLPYIQLMVSKATYEDSFQPSVGLMSRYAIHEHMFGASNYYVRISFANMNQVRNSTTIDPSAYMENPTINGQHL